MCMLVRFRHRFVVDLDGVRNNRKTKRKKTKIQSTIPDNTQTLLRSTQNTLTPINTFPFVRFRFFLVEIQLHV